MKHIHINFLTAFDELKFNIGFKTFADFLKGDLNPTIQRNHLDELKSYGVLYSTDKKEILDILDILIKENYIKKETINGSFQIIKRTPKGLKEIYDKKFNIEKYITNNIENTTITSFSKYKTTPITEEEKKILKTFNFFLKQYNQNQQRAIINNSKSLLCIAGAGSGKTSVLIKKIEFLNKFKSTKQKDILAITFTKKAKEEMQNRLNILGLKKVNVQTFNSFCEKILKQHSDKDIKIAKFSDKIKIIKKILKENGIKFENIIDIYFTKKQLKEKTPDELFFLFTNDIFSILDYYKNYKSQIQPFYENENNSSKRRIAKDIYTIVTKIKKEIENRKLRDFTDQILNTLKLFKENKNLIPDYSYILVDEFQDINQIQIELLKTLNPDNIFAVGDPRQAIYGWRGSDIKYILNFSKIFKNCQIIQLTKNYRSENNIVNFINLIVKNLKLENLESTKTDNKKDNIFLIKHTNELLEKQFIAQAIKNSKNPKNEIFILARTNKILENFAEFLSKQNIKYVIKNEEDYKNKEPQKAEVILATVHSIKGMQAKEVYIISANSISFPNKVQDNFIFSLIKQNNNYNKESEELRLFYVACSRAKEKLIISYTGNYSKFITSPMLKFVKSNQKEKSLFSYANSYKDLDSNNKSVLINQLKDWRTSKSQESKLPLYMILSNNTIEEIAARKPGNKIELMQINGLGPTKINKYGGEILKIINN